MASGHRVGGGEWGQVMRSHKAAVRGIGGTTIPGAFLLSMKLAKNLLPGVPSKVRKDTDMEKGQVLVLESQRSEDLKI